MSERSSSAAPGGRPGEGERPGGADERTPPLARDLSAVGTSYTWKFGDGGARAAFEAASAPPADGAPLDEVERLRARVLHLTAALEDVVALALSGADYKERAIMMHRRAVAALSSAAPRSSGAHPPSA